MPLVTFTARFSIGPHTIDDARNVPAGLGFVYNPGEHVIGTTTPLWTLLLAFCYPVGLHDLSATPLWLGALCGAGNTVLLFNAAPRFGFEVRWAAVTALLFSVCALSINGAVGGMEAPLFTFLVSALVPRLFILVTP